MKKYLFVWTVYKNPLDFPGKYVARKFVAKGQPFPTDEFFAHESLFEVREWVKRNSIESNNGIPFRMDRLPNDDPVILETWV